MSLEPYTFFAANAPITPTTLALLITFSSLIFLAYLSAEIYLRFFSHRHYPRSEWEDFELNTVNLRARIAIPQLPPPVHLA